MTPTYLLAGRSGLEVVRQQRQDRTDAGVRTVQRSWHTSGTTSFLVFQIIGEGVAKPGNGAAFLVLDDKDDNAGCKKG